MSIKSNKTFKIQSLLRCGARDSGLVACGFIYVISVLIVSTLDHEYCGNCVDSAFIEYTSVLSISIIWNGNVIICRSLV